MSNANSNDFSPTLVAGVPPLATNNRHQQSDKSIVIEEQIRIEQEAINNKNNNSNGTAENGIDTNNHNNLSSDIIDEFNFNSKDNAVATLSSPWEYDDTQPSCSACTEDFHPLNRRHHCRMCGKIFCNKCSDQRALIPPSSIVLVPKEGKKAKPRNFNEVTTSSNGQQKITMNANAPISFTPDDDPDRMLTYLDKENKLLYGKGLEERFQLAREPLRVCKACHVTLQPLQQELQCTNSNAMRFNHIDPTDVKRLFNSPIAFTLGHEVRKAAYTLNNLLPMPKRMGSVISSPDTFPVPHAASTELQQCKEECTTVSPSLGSLDGVKIPARLMQEAKGVAVITVVKGGFGIAGMEFGTGLVVARLDENKWSAPLAIGIAGFSWGALIGAQVSDHVFLLMDDNAVEMLFAPNGSLQLGADIGVALGPVGRAMEADFGASKKGMAPIYTYSLSKGFYAGISLDGKLLVVRDRINEKFYGRPVTGDEILSGQVPTPPAARPLYDALARCHVYAGGGNMRQLHMAQHQGQMSSSSFGVPPQYQQQQHQQQFQQQQQPLDPTMMEYGELQEEAIDASDMDHPLANQGRRPLPQPTSLSSASFPVQPAPIVSNSDNHSTFTAVSDLTSEPAF